MNPEIELSLLEIAYEMEMGRMSRTYAAAAIRKLLRRAKLKIKAPPA